MAPWPRDPLGSHESAFNINIVCRIPILSRLIHVASNGAYLPTSMGNNSEFWKVGYASLLL